MKPREILLKWLGRCANYWTNQSHAMLQFVESIGVHGLSAAGQVALALLTSVNFHRNILIFILVNGRAHSF